MTGQLWIYTHAGLRMEGLTGLKKVGPITLESDGCPCEVIWWLEAHKGRFWDGY